MAITAAPYGARPIGTLSSSGSFTGLTRHLPIITTYDTLISNGDFVSVHTDGTIIKNTGTTALGAVGIFMGCSYTDPTLLCLSVSLISLKVRKACPRKGPRRVMRSQMLL
jgi:hypothetical protein